MIKDRQFTFSMCLGFGLACTFDWSGNDELSVVRSFENSGQIYQLMERAFSLWPAYDLR